MTYGTLRSMRTLQHSSDAAKLVAHNRYVLTYGILIYQKICGSNILRASSSSELHYEVIERGHFVVLALLPQRIQILQYTFGPSSSRLL